MADYCPQCGTPTDTGLNCPKGCKRKAQQQELAELRARVGEWVPVSEPPQNNKDVLTVRMNCANDYAHPYTPEDSLRILFYENGSWWRTIFEEGGDPLPEDECPTHWQEITLPAHRSNKPDSWRKL